MGTILIMSRWGKKPSPWYCQLFTSTAGEQCACSVCVCVCVCDRERERERERGREREEEKRENGNRVNLTVRQSITHTVSLHFKAQTFLSDDCCKCFVT